MPQTTIDEFIAGDIVTVIKRYDSNTPIGLIGEFIQNDPISSDSNLIKFNNWHLGHDGNIEPGSDQYYWVPTTCLKKISSFNNTINDQNINNLETNMPTESKDVCNITFSREKGDQLLTIKTTKEIADLFKSGQLATSDNYFDDRGNKLKYQKEFDGLETYVEKFRSQAYGASRCTLVRYGTNLMIDGMYNFSVLRTDKIENGVTVKVGELILEDDVANWVQALGSFLKFLHRNYIDKVKIVATISMRM